MIFNEPFFYGIAFVVAAALVGVTQFRFLTPLYALVGMVALAIGADSLAGNSIFAVGALLMAGITWFQFRSYFL